MKNQNTLICSKLWVLKVKIKMEKGKPRKKRPIYQALEKSYKNMAALEKENKIK